MKNLSFLNIKMFYALLVMILYVPFRMCAAESESGFYTLNTQNGLSDNCVLQMKQINDGRLVVVTSKSIDIYDGQRFRTVELDTSRWMPVPAYSGATHLFADSKDRLFMKAWGRLYCFDLRTMRQVKLEGWNSDDFFIDDNGETWLLEERKLTGNLSKRTISMPEKAGLLQDVVSYGKQILTFFSTGTIISYGADGKQQFESVAYDEETSRRYDRTSLVVCGNDNHLYQVRTGRGGSILLSFDLKTKTWKQMMTSVKAMHTLTLTPNNIIYLTTADGYLKINPTTGQTDVHSELRLPDGSLLSTGINTVCLDREGGIWLGTYNNGLLYTSPMSGLFDTRPLDIEVRPILTTIYLHGQPLQVDAEYDGRVLLNVTAPYAEHLTFRHNQNSLAFQFSTMNYVRPRSTVYRYRFSGEENKWHTVSADSIGNYVDDKGVFYLPLVGLSPGDYQLEVMASTNPEHWNESDVRSISFTIEHPWWLSPIAFIVYALLLVGLGVMLFRIYRSRMQRKNRESMLLLRIQNLVEQVNQYEHSEAKMVLGEPEQEDEQAEDSQEPSIQEKEFMAKATHLVELHLSSPQYGVEQLAADLCMERTGLYKKLTTLMQQSPVVFIRSIRLHRAAEMLRQGNCSISDVAEYAGFCSASYFSKCFQKEFGCKPSEYISDSNETKVENNV